MARRTKADCVFCEIVAGRAPAQIVSDGADAIAIVPLNPVVSGHVLVIPKDHVADAAEDPALTGDVMEMAAAYAKRRLGVLYGSFNLITSVGAPATQTVMHLHVHLVPRREGDGLALPWTGQRKSLHPGLWHPNTHHTPPDGSKVRDRTGLEWVVTRDGGMVEHTTEDGGVRAAGIVWLADRRGPLTMTYIAPGE